MPIIYDYTLNYTDRTIEVSDIWKRGERVSGDLPHGTLIGRIVAIEPCRMHVGGGTKVHDGNVARFVFDVLDLEMVGPRGQLRDLGILFRYATEPFNVCGTHATTSHGGFAWGRNRNRLAEQDAEVTCTKCIARATKRA